MSDWVIGITLFSIGSKEKKSKEGTVILYEGL